VVERNPIFKHLDKTVPDSGRSVTTIINISLPRLGPVACYSLLPASKGSSPLTENFQWVS